MDTGIRGFRACSVTVKKAVVMTVKAYLLSVPERFVRSVLRQVGYLAYAGRQLQPYVRAAVDQFSPRRRSLTQRLLEKIG